MCRVFTAVALVLALAGCSWGEPDGSVELLTGGDGACWLGGEQASLGELVAEGEYGITFDGRPVMWPDGYTGRRAGAEVEVLDAHGNVRATTGRVYSIASMPDMSNEARNVGATAVAVDCGYPHDFVDCSVPSEYCDPT